ncbi:hypothetical protein [Haloarcula sp. 1CSR25-25]|uniref:DUF7405 family protein n=1 Tax=Haloarcula sp. 1CSR25-25 TaxID=2862545 RepID=UPI00289598E0|nr:hypothetical protein [Haloarcula sp. 1CSR25-25]MDT3434770.1 hypothetical protein [Haloarcula sp. 1CSR25-25]
MRTALAIGGSSALTAVIGAQPGAGVKGEGYSFDVPQGPENPNAFPERQHAWAQDLKTDPFGNGVLPNHQLILFLNYKGGSTPTGKERKEVEAAFRTLELAFQRLSGGDSAGDNEGLVFMVGYSRSYFDRFEQDLPNAVDFLRPEEVLRRTDDDPDKADNYDAVTLLSSATVSVLLGSEEALFGELDTLNGVSVRGSLEGIFEKAERRTAFVGKGLPRDNLVEDPDVPLTDEETDEITDEHVKESLREEAPLSMGYKSGFKDNLATEDAATITTGPFKEGTTFQVSKLELDLGKWYENDRQRRDELMFSHEHSPSDIGDIGEKLEDDSGISEEIVDDLEKTAENRGRVGHAAKTAGARNEDFEPLILRRSEGVNNSLVHPKEGKVGFNFSAVMEDIEDFVKTRQAMNASHLDNHIGEGGHGILPYMEVTNRATFLLPPRKHRSLPLPLPNE